MFDFEELLESGLSRDVVTSYNPDTVTPQPFAFVVDVSELSGGRAIEVAPNCPLRRAKSDEVKFIKGLIESLFGQHFSGGLWETRFPESGSGKFVRLPSKEWRYFVIEFPGGRQELKCLEESLTIAQCDLQIGFVLSKSTIKKRLVLPTCVYNPPRLFQSLSALSWVRNSKEGGGKVVSRADGRQISEVYMRLMSYDHSVLDLRGVFKQLFELGDLPHFSPLQVLGYFAILESILTHQPSPDDRYDSITRQITWKLALLNNRWQPQLSYSSFGSLGHEKLWSKMYAYRSGIAHGARPDFNSKLALLRSAEDANVLIKETVKQTIRHCLVEPQLLADLHNC
jgi:hypothetical protein